LALPLPFPPPPLPPSRCRSLSLCPSLPPSHFSPSLPPSLPSSLPPFIHPFIHTQPSPPSLTTSERRGAARAAGLCLPPSLSARNIPAGRCSRDATLPAVPPLPLPPPATADAATADFEACAGAGRVPYSACSPAARVPQTLPSTRSAALVVLGGALCLRHALGLHAAPSVHGVRTGA
jgi:hypothetical protein